MSIPQFVILSADGAIERLFNSRAHFATEAAVTPVAAFQSSSSAAN
jgi:hypothetical protein